MGDSSSPAAVRVLPGLILSLLVAIAAWTIAATCSSGRPLAADHLGHALRLPRGRGGAGASARHRRSVRTLIGVGTGICGASAIAAVTPVLETEESDVGYAVATIFVFCLDWIEHGDIERDELRDLLIGALVGALVATGSPPDLS